MTTMPRVLLIDLENCPSEINQLKIHLEKYSLVVVCYAQSGAKVPVDWLMPLTAIGNNKRLKWVKMPEVGKNAADFGITFWAGVLMSKLPQQTHFDIVSNDTDLDYAVSLLRDQKRSAERIGVKRVTIPVGVKKVTIPALQNQINPSEVENTHINKLDEFCLYLLNMKNAKPKQEKTLLSSIKSKFKTNDIDTLKIISNLIDKGIITINGVKVIYHEQKLNQFIKK